MEELSMKKMTKKVVIATTTGLASMILNAACGYGPPVEYEDPGSAYGISAEDASAMDSAADAASESSVSDTDTQYSSFDASSESSIEISADESTAAPSEDIIMEEVPSEATSLPDSSEDNLVDPGDSDNYKIPSIPAVYGPPTVDG